VIFMHFVEGPHSRNMMRTIMHPYHFSKQRNTNSLLCGYCQLLSYVIFSKVYLRILTLISLSRHMLYSCFNSFLVIFFVFVGVSFEWKEIKNKLSF